MSKKKRVKAPLWWSVFVSEYLKNGQNATRAYLAARPAVSEATAGREGWKTLKNPEVQEMLKKAEDRLVDGLAMSSDKWFAELCGIANAKQVKVNASAKIKALELIGKHQGYIKDRVEHSGMVGIEVVDPYAALPTEKFANEP